MKKKMRKFADGGVTEGQNPNIDDDTRSRAMKFVEDASEESRDIGAPVTRSASKSSSKVSQTVAPAKPTVDMDAEKARMDDLVKKQALERVEPENFVPGVGLLKGMIKSAAKPFAKEVASAASRVSKNDAAETAVRVRANKVRSEANDAAEIAVRNRAAKVRGKDNDAASKSVRARANKALEGMKAGGAVRSSASRRADGCAIRGKTRA